MTTRNPIGLAVTAFFALVLAIAMILGLAFGCKSYSRYQKRADVNNQIHIQQRQLKLYDLKVKQAIKLAEVKKQTAIGQKEANQEIAKRLTPMFIQFEMIEALKSIAASGKNNSVIYIPSGANGVPLVSISGKPQVLAGDTGAK